MYAYTNSPASKSSVHNLKYKIECSFCFLLQTLIEKLEKGKTTLLPEDKSNIMKVSVLCLSKSFSKEEEYRAYCSNQLVALTDCECEKFSRKRLENRFIFFSQILCFCVADVKSCLG